MTDPTQNERKPRNTRFSVPMKYAAVFALGYVAAYIPLTLTSTDDMPSSIETVASQVGQLETTTEHMRTVQQEVLFTLHQLAERPNATSANVSSVAITPVTLPRGALTDAAIDEAIQSQFDVGMQLALTEPQDEQEVEVEEVEVQSRD
tara:strand:+ start:5522 stop:5965 length:444 start_codon:yes stop_codon:yes gene_type:complete